VEDEQNNLLSKIFGRLAKESGWKILMENEQMNLNVRSVEDNQKNLEGRMWMDD